MTTPDWLDGDFFYPSDDASDNEWNADDYIEASWYIDSPGASDCSIDLWAADIDNQDNLTWVSSKDCACTDSVTYNLDAWDGDVYVAQFIISFLNSTDDDSYGELDSSFFTVNPVSAGYTPQTWGPDTDAQATVGTSLSTQTAGATTTGAATTGSSAPTGTALGSDSNTSVGDQLAVTAGPSTGTIAGAVVGAILGTLLLCLAAFLLWRKRTKRRQRSAPTASMANAWQHDLAGNGFGVQVDDPFANRKGAGVFEHERAELSEDTGLTSELPSHNERGPSELPGHGVGPRIS